MKFPVLWLSFVSIWVGGIAGPHQLYSCQYFNLLEQINNKETNKCFRERTLSSISDKGAAAQVLGSLTEAEVEAELVCPSCLSNKILVQEECSSVSDVNFVLLHTCVLSQYVCNIPETHKG